MRGERYQYALIALFILIIGMVSIFFYREVNPEYKQFQKAYVALEDFRADLMGTAPPPFSLGVKQIVIKEDKGPETIDRCISCHVALEVEDFSPTTQELDINGNIVLDENGVPKQTPNPNYIFTKLDEKIALLRDSAEAEELKKLKTIEAGGKTYEASKILKMHPLIGKERRPFEFHPIDQYGCTSCHSGNGRALTIDKAHGPVFDGEYEISYEGPKPQFLELDPENDPAFSRMFNDKPGHSILFQTTPILIGPLIEARCVQCHRPDEVRFEGAKGRLALLARDREEIQKDLQKAIDQEINAYLTYVDLEQRVQSVGFEEAKGQLEERSQNYRLSQEERSAALGQLRLLMRGEKEALKIANEKQVSLLGSQKLVNQLNEALKGGEKVKAFLKANQDSSEANGSLFEKLDQLELDRALLKHYSETKESLTVAGEDQKTMERILSDVDRLTSHFQRGERLYIQHACYACHRIAGFARGGVGPELTFEGLKYPWFIKQSIVWPQADLKSSTMPNPHLDHEELQDLMVFLLAQRGKDLYSSPIERQRELRAWEAGEKGSLEMPVDLKTIESVEAGMITFATQGCAACHRLEGYESAVGFTVEKENPSFEELYREKQWFKGLIPEDVGSSELVRILETHRDEINERIQEGVNEPGTLEKLEKMDPQLIRSFYPQFQFANRAKDDDEWRKTVRLVLMTYVQEYGLGKIVGPKPNWSGVYRSDQWLMEHFWNPTSHVARSIMPAFAFDNTKFWQLTYMLDQLGKKNRDELREVWETFGFDPAMAYDIHCAQCHGDSLKGNGPVAEWIYPIPKNLRSADFLRNLTKERAIESIVHGIKGGPMPPWSEVWPEKGEGYRPPVITEEEAKILVDWLFEGLPGRRVIRETPKWDYSPEDVIEDLEKEGNLPKLEKPTTLRSGLINLDWFKLPLATFSVSDLFDKKEHPVDGTEESYYTIKKRYYTEENLKEGKRLFLLHCAVCHGPEGDGGGPRAETMEEAKPRMLTNLNWIDTRDDIRLLRSIKYGVTGTSMTAFGETTTALQRLQLVMYIRSLSEEQKNRKYLGNALYQVYDTSERALLSAKTQADSEKQQLIAQLQEQLEREKALRSSLGNMIISKKESARLYPLFEAWLNLEEERFRYRDGKLIAQEADAQRRDQLAEQLEGEIKREIASYNGQIESLSQRINSPQRREEIAALEEQKDIWVKLLKEFETVIGENERSQTRQSAIIKEINRE